MSQQRLSPDSSGRAIHHHAAPAGLDAWLVDQDVARAPTVVEAELDGEMFVVKRERGSWWGHIDYALRYIRAAGLAVFCKVLLGEFPSPSVLLRNGLSYETERLVYLNRIGCAVPAVWRSAPGLLVLEHVGVDLADLIRNGTPEYRLALTLAAGQDLAAFHRRGLWHGGSQIRNLTVRDGRLWRIDFEENIGDALSLPLAQAYDLFQMLASLLSLRALSPTVMHDLGRQMLEHYFHANPSDEIRFHLMRISRLLDIVSMILHPLLGRLPWRDVQGFFRVVDVLHRFLKS